ncbi:hypothetical protein K435DRAFT_615688, partial [Dendrothele bispora CBS 962.96]
EHLLCSVNVQHNCSKNGCSIQDIMPIFQERQKTNQKKGAVVHLGNLNDVVLNTAQMRDAKYIQ